MGLEDPNQAALHGLPPFVGRGRQAQQENGMNASLPPMPMRNGREGAPSRADGIEEPDLEDHDGFHGQTGGSTP
jgi:hypothetical protein